MGVPALFRWLSKKYPRIVSSVEEEHPRKVPREDGQEGEEELPIDMSGPNPNGEEYDNLYLDMNGIVHPCTHPEGKPAPETEEEMMVEIFAYTERVVNMIRPRKLLMMAIDGVAPRAKMNQQRSRRFRAAQEAKEKLEEKEKALEEWKAMGLPVTDEAAENKKAWDSNAITPGTPFMDLLASSLRYWVAKKLNTDPGWKNLQVVISDASVPGEGEHKIMDFIRRQRAQPEHDANTRHVIYGLDADLIMLSLATHEPYFKVLREDVFAQDQKIRKCHRCGREGHIAANCIGEAKEKSGENDDVGAKPPEKKPFIFLDVVALREYLEVELDVPGLPFKFDLERAIDDWVFLIFFVGNDFLPHLPSLEIREGAIDTLLRIWKKELPGMGSYLTNHGKVEMANAQIILEGIAKEEDDIFRRRKETEERQDSNAKRRKIEDEARQRREMAQEKGFRFGEQTYVEAPTRTDDKDVEQAELKAQALAALESGKNEDIIANQRAIRMANLSAAEKLKAELKGKATRDAAAKGIPAETETEKEVEKVGEGSMPAKSNGDGTVMDKGEDDVGPSATAQNGDVETTAEQDDAETMVNNPTTVDPDGNVIVPSSTAEGPEQPHAANGHGSHSAPQSVGSDQQGLRGQKRSIDDVETQEIGLEGDAQEVTDPITTTNKERKLNPDGSVEYEDTVKLWEPGYRERYYQQKFGVGLDDVEFRRSVVQSYMEGMSWVLAYYYQGCPSWTWYYPYHFSPFAADFTDLDKLKIEFNEGKPFRPYDQLMGVLPAASRASIPQVFHPLMTEEDSEIIDFYPETFSIDMNGKKMAWQGVALLPFIDENRLLKAINERYGQLSEDEVRRNEFGDHALLVAEENKMYDELCALYAKKRTEDAKPVALDPANSGGITGFVRPDPGCVPGSTYISPLTSVGLNDLLSDRSISALLEFPPQSTPHRSVLLKGVRMPKRVLTHEDREWTRRGGPSSRGGRGRGGRFNSGSYNHHSMHMEEQNQRRSVAMGGSGVRPMRYGNGPAAGMSGPNGAARHQRWDGTPHDGPYGHYAQQNVPQNVYGGGHGHGGAAYGADTYAAAQPPARPTASYEGYGGYGSGYGQAGGGAPPAAYAGYGGYGGGGDGAPAGGYGGYGGYGSGGGYPPAPQQYGGPPPQAPQGLRYGQGHPGYGYGGGQPQTPGDPQRRFGNGPPPQRGGAAPRPMGYRSGAPGGGRGGHQQQTNYGGGPYGRY